MTENQDFLHAPIVASVMGLRNMAIRLCTVKFIMIAVLLLAATGTGAVEKISLQALFKDKAIIVVDGARRVLKSGETSPEGIKLLATDTQEEKAEVEIDGKREVLRLGVVVAGFDQKGKGSVVLYPDRGGHFFADGQINGTRVRFLVDTGASTVTMNGLVAKRVGLDYRRTGRAGYSNTAAGVVPKYQVKLDKVQVGDITLYNVDGGVIEDMTTTEVLLGMSFLGQFDMKRDSEKMELSER
jgi:aspartyl protease family protein